MESTLEREGQELVVSVEHFLLVTVELHEEAHSSMMIQS